MWMPSGQLNTCIDENELGREGERGHVVISSPTGAGAVRAETFPESVESEEEKQVWKPRKPSTLAISIQFQCEYESSEGLLKLKILGSCGIEILHF